MDSATDSGGRVTRALRKRLTSIDSDNSSSRPGTPVQSKLAAATTNSPLKPRMTRRNSTSGVGTPVKTTGKRAATPVTAIAEELNNGMSGRRSTRRTSLSQIENETTPKVDKKLPNFESLAEEQVTTRITRSKSKSPEQATGGKMKTGKTQRGGRKSMLLKETEESLSQTKDDTDVEAKSDSENSVVSNKKEKLEESSPTKRRKSILAESEDGKKPQNNEKDELELNASTQKRKSLLAAVSNDKEELNELPEEEEEEEDDPTSVNEISKSPEGNNDRDMRIASSQNRKSMSPNATKAVDKLLENIDVEDETNTNNNSDDVKLNATPPKQMSPSNSVETTSYQKSPEKDEVDHVETSQDKDADDKSILSESVSNTSPILADEVIVVVEETLHKTDNSNTSPQARKSLSVSISNTSPILPEEEDIVVGKETLKKTEMNEESKTNSPLKRQSLLNSISPMKDDECNSSHNHDNAHEMPVETSKSEDSAQSPSVVTLKEHLVDETITDNVVTGPADSNKIQSSDAFTPNRVGDSQKEANSMDMEDAISTNSNVCVTSPPSSETASCRIQAADSSIMIVDSITPARNPSGLNPYASTEGDSVRRVAFSSNISDNEAEKSIYPKTPASIKSKSFTENHSSKDDDKLFVGECSNNDSVMLLEDTTDVVFGANKTIADDDTVVSIEEDKNESKDIEKNQCLSPSPNKADAESLVQDSPDIKLRWYNPRVVAKSSKLDTIKNDEEIVESSVLDDDKLVVKKKKKRTFKKRNEWNDDENPHEDGDVYDDEYLDDEEQEEEKKYAPKHAFHDDEVMVVDDYESGDSMDSEERREIVENELNSDGESIGSQTTDGEDDDENDSDIDSFIVDDELVDENSSAGSRSEYDEEIEEYNDVECTDREKKKNYKRIQRVTETSSDEDEPSMKNRSKAKVVSEDEGSDKNSKLKVNTSLKSSRLNDSARRLQCFSEDDESNNSDVEDENDVSKEDISPAKDASKTREGEENLKLMVEKSLNCSILSDSARQLQSGGDLVDESDNSNNEDDVVNVSRKDLLKKLNHSDRFNKSVRDLNSEVDVSPDVNGKCVEVASEEEEVEEEEPTTTMNESKKNKQSENHLGEATDTSEDENENDDGGSDSGKDTDEENENIVIRKQTAKAKFMPEEETIIANGANESILNESKKMKRMMALSSKHLENHLGEETETSEQGNGNLDGGSDSGKDADEEKENSIVEQTAKAKYIPGLSVSFGTFKQQQKSKNSLQKQVLQRSFTIGVSVNGGELETEVFQNKIRKSKAATSSSSPSASVSSNGDTDGDVLSSDDVRFLENIKHMPLGNPLVRTRRQSLALPTNPDMEIGSAQHSGATRSSNTKKRNRKSLAVLSGNEYNPSQSFVHSLELRKAELQRQTSKRKRMSKSFSGTAADDSVIDIDVRHLHKRSKISTENIFAESFKNTNPDNTLCLDENVGHSSTPHEKASSSKVHNNSGIRRILNRCDEILEAANRAKLESKINYLKSKIRAPKKNRKRKQSQTSSPESKREKVFPVRKEIKKRDKTKVAVTQALKASADIIIGKDRRKQQIRVDSVASNRLPADILKTIEADSQSTSKKKKTECVTEQNLKYRNYSTAAGIVVERFSSPQRKKNPKIIRLSTGYVCVEPITPTKRSIRTCNGMEFHESPMTPRAVGFKVCDVLSSNGSHPPIKGGGKRKRGEDGRKHTFPTPQWTQSGLFFEEEIPSDRITPLPSICQGRISKRAHLGQTQAINSINFKQIALQRGDIKRSTAREILQLRERRQMHGHY